MPGLAGVRRDSGRGQSRAGPSPVPQKTHPPRPRDCEKFASDPPSPENAAVEITQHFF